MRKRKYNKDKVFRYAAWGGGLVGGIGFLIGLLVCLHYKLPIPPVFITEMGLAVGGIAGALTAVYEVESRVIPTLLALFAGSPACWVLGLGAGTTLAVLSFLGVSAWIWSEADAPEAV